MVWSWYKIWIEGLRSVAVKGSGRVPQLTIATFYRKCGKNRQTVAFDRNWFIDSEVLSLLRGWHPIEPSLGLCKLGRPGLFDWDLPAFKGTWFLIWPHNSMPNIQGSLRNKGSLEVKSWGLVFDQNCRDSMKVIGIIWTARLFWVESRDTVAVRSDYFILKEFEFFLIRFPHSLYSIRR